MTLQGSQALAFLSDRFFWLAFMLGPVVWVMLFCLFPANVSGGGGDVTGGSVPLESNLLATLRLLFLFALVYPVLEEIVFRGGLQGFLLEKPALAKSIVTGSGDNQSPWLLTPANLITSVAFTAMHFINHPPLWASLVFFPSLVFGWARDRYDHLWASMLLHAFYNAGFLLLFAQP